jgi:16S rRNA (guanine527-N7)-methyltransferase
MKNLDVYTTEKLKKLVELLRVKNQELNLSAIKDPEEIWQKHILDSLAPAEFFDFKKVSRVIDVGTGGGFPGLPLAILFPKVEFVLLDSIAKKIDAVKFFASELGLKNVTAIVGRAEELGRSLQHREKYDAVVSRAVAPLSVLLELLSPLAKVGGQVLSYKGPNFLAEIMESAGAMEKLKLTEPAVHHYSLPPEGERVILSFEKMQATPEEYPRRTGIPEKRPL